MSCKSCGASKVEYNACAYCGNPLAHRDITYRDITYIDVSNVSYKDTRKLLKSFKNALDGQAISVPYSKPLSDRIWTLKTPTPGRPYWR